MLTFLIDLFTNPVFLAAASGWFVAQASKMILETVKHGFHPERLSGGGGMPSAHSATVVGLTCETGIVCGGSSAQFVIALFLAIIVIYDAMGVRYLTGRQAAALNRLRSRDLQNGIEPVTDRELDEKMGHTLPEILVGCLVGILCATVVHILMK